MTETTKEQGCCGAEARRAADTSQERSAQGCCDEGCCKDSPCPCGCGCER